MPGGRPSAYEPDYAEQARKLCLLGATDAQLADFFEVSEATINNWKKAHPEFLESIRSGKDLADAQVADSLYQRACGYSHPETKILQYEGQPIEVETVKHYPPDTAAAIIWLKNRQPGKWRDRIDHAHGIDPDSAGVIILPAPIENWDEVAKAEQAKIAARGRPALPPGSEEAA